MIDVREPVEFDIVHIDGRSWSRSRRSTPGGSGKAAADRMPVLYCKTGVRSAQALAVLKQAGFADAVHLEGGIVAWAQQMQPDMILY